MYSDEQINIFIKQQICSAVIIQGYSYARTTLN